MEQNRGKPKGTNPKKLYMIDFNKLKINEMPGKKLGGSTVYKRNVDFFGPDLIQSENELPSSADEGGTAV